MCLQSLWDKQISSCGSQLLVYSFMIFMLIEKSCIPLVEFIFLKLSIEGVGNPILALGSNLVFKSIFTIDRADYLNTIWLLVPILNPE